jgi:N-dimethylarginine dimethylaminohydrolase
MKKLITFILLPSSFILSSCACPHRRGESSRVMETFTGRPDGLVHRETWRDYEKGGGEFLFTDPAAGQLFAAHTNQSALGGGSVFSAGTVTITVDTNTASIMGATGTAVGNVIGAASKTAVK